MTTQTTTTSTQPTVQAHDSLLRAAMALASKATPDSRWCELTSADGHGQCKNDPVAFRWEMGYLDEVCEHHAQTATDRGALVIYPRRHDGTTTP